MTQHSNQIDVTDPLGRNVVCSEEYWEKHILAKRPFMKGWEKHVASTIEHPNVIASDADYENRIVYYRLEKSGKRYIKVVVEKTNEKKNGEIKTSHPADSIKEGENILWVRKNA